MLRSADERLALSALEDARSFALSVARHDARWEAQAYGLAARINSLLARREARDE